VLELPWQPASAAELANEATLSCAP
jgi:hypothetical protein